MFKIKKLYNRIMNNPYRAILSIQLIIYLSFCIIYYKLIPYLLNYPPNSINTPFQLTVNPTYYWVYYVVLCVVCTGIVFITSSKILHPIKILKKENLTLNEKLYIRNACNKFSINNILLYGVALPCFIACFGLLISKTGFILTMKISLIILIFLGIPSIIYYTLSNIVLREVFIKTFDKEVFEKEEISNSHIWLNIVLQTLPSLILSIVFIFLIFITNLSNEISEYQYSTYKERISNIIKNLEGSELSEQNIIDYLNDALPNERWFIKIDDQYYYPENTREISDFMKKYIDFYATGDYSKVYDSYGETVQGIVSYINLGEKEVLVGIVYNTLSENIFLTMLLSLILFLIVDYVVLYITSKALGSRINDISNRLFNISKSNNIKEELLPIISNDELAILTKAFNETQLNTIKLVSQIQNNQDILMERERLASLGQLIGGIAHNLKTPIMSIAGATEGLSDLIKEYDCSIENPNVNFQDHHEIARDMREWITKIKEYTEYMSDIITTVKGQTVTLSNDTESNFTISELLKRVDILMKHELKNAIIYLNITVNMDESTVINGDVNSLVQVINNIISNSIQAYNGKPNQTIELNASTDGKNAIISIRDYGSGIPKNIKNKLFKEMITTKGKNGTGLGLYMCYSTVKAHFKGNITFESEEGKGTQFNIILPL